MRPQVFTTQGRGTLPECDFEVCSRAHSLSPSHAVPPAATAAPGRPDPSSPLPQRRPYPSSTFDNACSSSAAKAWSQLPGTRRRYSPTGPKGGREKVLGGARRMASCSRMAESPQRLQARVMRMRRRVSDSAHG